MICINWIEGELYLIVDTSPSPPALPSPKPPHKFTDREIVQDLSPQLLRMLKPHEASSCPFRVSILAKRPYTQAFDAQKVEETDLCCLT